MVAINPSSAMAATLFPPLLVTIGVVMACPRFLISFEKYHNEIGIAMDRPTKDMGVAHRKKSINESSALKAIKTPTGLPTTVALLPMFVAKTIIITKGIGLIFSFDVKCRTVAVINRMEVTSSTRAANIADMSINITTSFLDHCQHPLEFSRADIQRNVYPPDSQSLSSSQPKIGLCPSRQTQ